MADLSFMKNRVNILVLGIDRSEERLESNSFRSDTIILVTVNFKTGDVDMISFPRDSYVKLYNKNGKLIDPLDPYNKRGFFARRHDEKGRLPERDEHRERAVGRHTGELLRQL